MVGVVEKDHVARLQVARGAARDALRCRELAPVPAPARPEERLHASFSDGLQSALAVDPEWWAVELALADDFDRLVQVGLNGGDRESGHDFVAVTVDADLVPAPFYLRDELREAFALFADNEEDCVDERVVKRVEDGGGALGMWPVVERDRGERPVEA